MSYGARLRTLLREPWDVVHCWEEPYVAAAAQVAAWTPAHVPLVFATFQNIDKQYPAPFAGSNGTDGPRRRPRGLRPHGAGRRSRAGLPARASASHSAWRGHSTLRAERRRARAGPRGAWLEDDTPVVGFVGRFVKEKGVLLLTDVLGRMPTPWRALFVGAGPLERELRCWAAPFGDRVAVATTVAHEEVPDWLNAMDVLCAPSQTTPRWREQFGRMLIEAFATGVPVVAAASGEIPHVVADAGVLVAENDLAAWERTLGAILADPRAPPLAERGRAHAVSHYDWSVVARQHAAFFGELAA